MKCLTYFLFLALPVCGFSQDLTYAHKLVDTLTSEIFSGRGYVNSGDKNAAAFIAGEYRKFGLDSFEKGYFQTFDFPVNTFPGKMDVVLDETSLLPGIDYIVNPACSSISGSFNIIIINTIPALTRPKKVKNKFICIDKSQCKTKEESIALDAWLKDIHGASGIIFIEEKKLTWSVSTYQQAFPIIHILKKSLPTTFSKINLTIEAYFNKAHPTQNIVGFIKGTQATDSFLVFTGHYDHLGMMGNQTRFPGANDNASGISMLLNLVKYYTDISNRPKYSMLFIAFAGEEAGLIGSHFYTLNPLFPLSKIKFLINMDLMGTGDEGMMVVNGDVYKNEYELLTKINTEKNYLKKIEKRGKAKNSDHYYFSENGVPCFFFYTLGGITAYHDIYDVSQTLPFTDYADVFLLIRDFVATLSK